MKPSPRSSRPSGRFLSATLASLVAIAVGNTTASAVAQPSIMEAFNVPGADVAWIVFGYLAAFAIATAMYGSIGRRFGAAPALSAGVTLFGLGSLAAILAPTIWVLVAARVVQGLGAGAIPTLTMVILSDRFRGKRRALAIGIQIAGVGVGHALGPLAGGILVSSVGWRAAVSLGLLALLTLPVLLRVPAMPNPIAAVDLRGAVLVAILVGCGVWVVNRGLGGDNLATVAAVSSAGVAALLLLAGHVHGFSHGIVPRRVISDRSFRSVALDGALGQCGFLLLITALPLVFGADRGLQGVRLGLTLVPMALGVALVSPRHWLVTARVGRRGATTLAYAGIMAGGLTVAAVGSVAPLWVIAGLLVMSGAGFGLLNAPLVDWLATHFPGSEKGPALGLYNLTFFAGGAVGSALASVGAGAPTIDPATGFLVLEVGLALVVVPRALWLLATTRDRSHPVSTRPPR